jgi:hypothetical protein
MSAAWEIAHAVEWAAASERVRLGRLVRGKVSKRRAIAAEYDPHAATELALLIEHKMSMGETP